MPGLGIAALFFMLAQTMADVIAGKTDPKLRTAVAYMAVALLRAYEAEPPVSPAGPSIYTALQYRTASNAGITEPDGQKEVRALGCVATDALLVQDVEAEAAPPTEDLGYEVLDVNTDLPVTRYATANRTGLTATHKQDAGFGNVTTRAALTKAEVVGHKQAEEFEILDYWPRPRRKAEH